MKNAVGLALSALSFCIALLPTASFAGPCDAIVPTRNQIYLLAQEIEEKQALYASAKTDEQKARLIDKILLPSVAVSATVGLGATIYLYGSREMIPFQGGRLFTATASAREVAGYASSIGWAIAGGLIVYAYFETPADQIKHTAEAVTEYMKELTAEEKDYQRLIKQNDELIARYHCI